MKRVIVPLGGMSNVPDANVSRDGDMQLLVNMKHSGGDVVPMAKPESKYIECDKAYVHAASGHTLIIRGKDLYDFDTKTSLATDVVSCSFIGRMVRVQCSAGSIYIRWNGEEYICMGALPKPPALSIDLGEKDYKVAYVPTDTYYYSQRLSEDEQSEVERDSLWTNARGGFYDTACDVLYKNGFFIDSVMFRVGLRLFDGTYIVSPIYYVADNKAKDDITEVVGSTLSVGGGIGNFKEEVTADPDGKGRKQKHAVCVRGFKPHLTFDTSVPSGWSDIIVGVDVFTSGSVMYHKREDESYTTSNRVSDNTLLKVTEGAYPKTIWREKSKEEYDKDVRDAFANMYRYATYDVNDGSQKTLIEDTSPSNIAVQERLANILTAHELVSENALVYNNRVHLAGAKTVLAQCGVSDYLPPSFSVGDYVDYSVELEIDGQTKRVNGSLLCGDYNVRPIITYPDRRATAIIIDDAKIPLTAHDTLDMAYYAPKGEDDHWNENWLYKDISLSSWINIGVIGLEDKECENQNLLYVSEVDNPFHFPHSYVFDSKLIGLATSAEAVSSGQFGQYPLNVFTEEGIWVMGIDSSGKGAYVTQTPASREVCTGQYCSIPGGVVFITNRGVMLLQGSQVTNLSATLDREVFESIEELDSSFVEALATRGASNVNLVYLRTFLKDCNVAYDYSQNVLMLGNKEKFYSLVYSLDSGLWSVIDEAYGQPINSYPILKTLKDNNIYTFEGETPKADIMLITRPVKVGTTNHKRVIEAALRGRWKCSKNTEALCFYILGSNDAANWVVIGGVEDTKTDRRDLVVSVTRSKSYRYIAFAVAAKEFEGRLSCIEMLVSEGMAQNKLV